MSHPGRFVYVAAVEGLDTLLCTSNASGVVTAWNGTDWTTASACLYVDLNHTASCHPWEPFTDGGDLRLTITDNDIGTLMHRTAGAADTELTAGVDRDDTTLAVKDTSAFPASGHVYIGNETIAYSSKDATNFLSCARGKFHPIGCDSSGLGGTAFAYPHRIERVSYAPNVAPRVTGFPTEWTGRWVALYLHAYESDGTLQGKSNTQRVFVGRIADVKDEPEKGNTVITVDSAITLLKDAVLGADQFTATLADGIYLKAGTKFHATDYNETTLRTANDLVVVTSGAAGTNQINEGQFSQSDLHAALNTWLAAELTASRLHGTYIFSIDLGDPNLGEAPVTKVGWEIPGTGQGAYSIGLPKNVAAFMGFTSQTIQDQDSEGSWHSTPGDEIPLRIWSPLWSVTNVLTIENLNGVFSDQYDSMPVSMKPSTTGPDGAGLFIFDDKFLISARIEDNGDGTYELSGAQAIKGFGEAVENGTPAYTKRVDEGGEVKIRQIAILEGAADTLINQIVYSTGNLTAYNHDTHDVLPWGVGLGWPGGLFGAAWEASVANLPGATKPIAIVIDKPIKLSKLLGSDLLLRHAFPVFSDGGIVLRTWQTPTLSLATATLTEANKSEPSSNDVNHRTATLLSDRWKSDVIKVQFNHSVLGDGDYSGLSIIEDRTSADDSGGDRDVRTIEAINTYSEFLETGSEIHDILVNAFIPTVTLFTKAMRTLRRSISADLFFDLVPGQIVSVTDSFARDPDSGERSFSSRPAIVIRVQNEVRTQENEQVEFVGEVELMLTRGNRFFAYAPSALVGSYDSGTKTLTCAAHTYSESSEPADAENFAADYAIRITEVDPDDPANPLTWSRGVTSVSGNDIVHESVALAGFDPAKTYRITYDRYSSAASQQQDKAFQADDADGLIEDEAQANTFGLATSSIVATDSAHTDLPERHAEVQFGDGAPFDVGQVVGLQRMIDNLIDHKTALSVPLLGTTMTNTTYSSGQARKTVAVFPIALTTATLSNSVMRYVSIAPFLRSSDGTATSVRISLCDRPPVSNSIEDIDPPQPTANATWNTSSTTWATGTPTTLSLNVKDGFGWGWIVIECGYKAECRGIAKFVEGERMEFV